jgi:hypothetical protein
MIQPYVGRRVLEVGSGTGVITRYLATRERVVATAIDTDYLDLLQLHNPPLDVVTAPAVREALAGLVKSGKIRAWGVSAKGPDEALQALRACEIAVVQANFNMMDVRVLGSGLLAEVERLGVGFVGRTPLCFGFLSGDRPCQRPGRRSPCPLAARPARELGRWRGRPDGGDIRVARRGGSSGCAALLPVVPGGIDHHSGHHAAAGGRPERRGEPLGATAATSRRGGPGDPSKSTVLRLGLIRVVTKSRRSPLLNR